MSTRALPIWVGGNSFSGSVDVVSTPLVAAVDCAWAEALLFVLANDGANIITIVVETGEFTGVWDPGAALTLDVDPGTQRTIEIPVNLRRIYRMSGTAAVALTAARWGLRAVRRGFPQPGHH